jgi:hypothetical protein
VERAAYLVVADGIDAAVREGADHVQVIARRARGVGALGGRIAIEDRTLRAEVPCA